MTDRTRGPLVERLRATEPRKSYLATNRTATIVESDYDAPINPDGPEAAAVIVELREALEQAGKRFRGYEQLHLTKFPPDTAKARRNAIYAQECEDALSREPAGGEG